MLGLLLDGEAPAGFVEFGYAVTFWIVDPVSEYGRCSALCVGYSVFQQA